MRLRAPFLAAVFATLAGTAAASEAALQAFSQHCFSPFLTAARADAVLPARHDFYDLRPFRASNPVSPPEGRAATPGTDRRCEVAFDGRAVAAGMETISQALAREGIVTQAPVPAGFPLMAGTEFAAARQLNPRRIAVVQVGTRPGPNGPETFLNVERLDPLP
ncbi:MAG: succinyl-CoA synthetase subunit beta [Pseudomonadota bacterium]